jgi:ethanolamine ammonia-lyase large subunit
MSITEQWDSFALNCIPADAPEHQMTDMQRSFFAGACAALTLINPHMDTLEQASEVFDTLAKEVQTFSDELQKELRRHKRTVVNKVNRAMFKSEAAGHTIESCREVIQTQFGPTAKVVEAVYDLCCEVMEPAQALQIASRANVQILSVIRGQL